MVPPCSDQVSRVWPYSGSCAAVRIFTYVTLTLFGTFSHTFQLEIINTKCCPKPHKYCYLWFSLFRFRSPLLTESISLSFPPLTEMFHFSGFRVSYPMYSGMNDRVLPRSGYPIRIPPDHRLLAASRGFSQLAASFFACWHQGIHRTPLLTSSYCKSFLPLPQYHKALS